MVCFNRTLSKYVTKFPCETKKEVNKYRKMTRPGTRPCRTRLIDDAQVVTPTRQSLLFKAIKFFIRVLSSVFFLRAISFSLRYSCHKSFIIHYKEKNLFVLVEFLFKFSFQFLIKRSILNFINKNIFQHFL